MAAALQAHVMGDSPSPTTLDCTAPALATGAKLPALTVPPGVPPSFDGVENGPTQLALAEKSVAVKCMNRSSLSGRVVVPAFLAALVVLYFSHIMKISGSKSHVGKSKSSGSIAHGKAEHEKPGCICREAELTDELMRYYCGDPSTYVVDRSPTARGCNESYTANVRHALANEMFEGCGAWCLYDTRNASEMAFVWNAENKCWNSDGAEGCLAFPEKDVVLQRSSQLCNAEQTGCISWRATPTWDFNDADYTGEYLHSAQGFQVNEDLNLKPVLHGKMDRRSFMSALKDATEKKPSILVINDKFLMTKVVEKIGIPTNKVLFEVHPEDSEAAVKQKLQHLNDTFRPFIVKPTHTSEGVGQHAVSSKEKYNMDSVEETIKKNLKIRAAAHESWVLRNLKPGVIAEELYTAEDLGTGDAFFQPYEIKVQTAWGRFFLGVMEGMPTVNGTKKWDIQYWIRRDGMSSCDVTSPMVGSPCFPALDAEAKAALPLMIKYAEKVATMLGAPWLRVDFFVGSKTAGIRLNELAYGSGLPYPLLDNDLGKIMTRGFLTVNFKEFGRDHFLKPLGCSMASAEPDSMQCEEPMEVNETAATNVVVV